MVNACPGLRKARCSPCAAGFAAAASLAIAVGCGSPTAPMLQAGESCEGQPRDAVAAFADPALQGAVMSAVGAASAEDLTCGRLADLSELEASAAGITSLVGIQNLTGLILLDLSENPVGDIGRIEGLGALRVLFARSAQITSLLALQRLGDLSFVDLADNSITDVAPLAGLTELAFLDLRDNAIGDIGPLTGLGVLRFLYLSGNAISDVGPLSSLQGLTTVQLGGNTISSVAPLAQLIGLTVLYLDGNTITDLSPLTGLTSVTDLDLSENITLSDVQPLIDNVGLGPGDRVNLRNTAVPCPSITELRAKGPTVDSGCP